MGAGAGTPGTQGMDVLYLSPHTQHLPFLIAAASSVRTAQPYADVQQDSKATGQSAQASEDGIPGGKRGWHVPLRDLCPCRVHGQPLPTADGEPT